MKFTVMTLGCKVNSYESMSYIESFKQAGYTLVDQKDVADIYIVNSCAVTNAAANKTRQRINQAYRLNENALIAVVGCYAQVEIDKLLSDHKIDLIVGSNQKGDLVKLVQQVMANDKVVAVDKDSRNFEYEDLAVTNFENHHRAFLKVQDGCDQFCSYCIIPFARGNERSQRLEVVVDNALHLVKSGNKEIVLSGIHTGRYGKELNTSLYELMNNLISDVVGLERLRVSSIEVLEINDDIIDLAKRSTVLANHWHIPLQAGSDKILKAMNRRYTTAQYADKIEYLRSQLPNVSISADVIVGFPNESEEDFMETYNFIKALNLSFLHVFPYSPKNFTPAQKMANQVDGLIKKERVRKLLQLSKQLANNYISSFINKTVIVLTEGQIDGYYKGYASEYFEVRFKSEKPCNNEMVAVIIERIDGDIAYGRRL